jgi:hypothetical protein
MALFQALAALWVSMARGAASSGDSRSGRQRIEELEVQHVVARQAHG